MFTKEEVKKMLVVVLILSILIVVYHLSDNFDKTLAFLIYIKEVFTPIIFGFIIAFIVNIPMMSIENTLFNEKRNIKSNNPTKRKSHKKAKRLNRLTVLKLKAGHKRIISLLITVIIIISLTTLIFSFTIPQLVNSIDSLMVKIPDYIVSVGQLLEQKFKALKLDQSILEQIINIWESIVAKVSNLMLNIANVLYNYFYKIISGLFNLIISIVLAIYMLINKEKLLSTFHKIFQAFYPKEHKARTIKYLTIINRSFQQFIRGQIMEAIILGLLCYLGMLLFQFDYALLISVLVGVTNIIPIFGPYIGGIPSILLLLMVNPISALWFIVFLIVLQQIEGNIIYPRVVGNSMGISGFWILTAVIIGNNLFGLVGVLLGIPIFSSIYIIFKEVVNERLKLKSE